jgi:D-3-phosphoglycerate dehydrogenase / 2-oxoglutarate reductase
MIKILTLNKIDPQGLENFPAGQYEISDTMENPDAIVLRSFKMTEKELTPSLKAIARAGAGVNNIPVELCTEKGIVVFNTPGANANGVKELVIAGLLLSSRNIADSIVWAKTLIGQGDQVPALVEKGKTQFGGQEIKGKTLGVIGLGAIGILVANDALALGMKVVGFDPYLSAKQALKLDSNVQQVQDIDTLYAESDYITLNVPLLPETKNLINKEKLTLMKNGVRILNFARGGLVNNTDLAEAIEAGKVSWYVTDFPDEETLKMKNVISIPHLGASTEESETNCAIMAVNQVREYLENGNIINSVNFPQAEMNRGGGARLLIANKNNPNLANLISSILANAQVNISNMLNKNSKEITYNIIDVDKKTLDESIKDKILAVDGVLMVRIL